MVQLWDAERRTEIARFEGHDGVVNSLAFSLDGRRLVSGSWGKMRAWDIESGRCVAVVVRSRGTEPIMCGDVESALLASPRGVETVVDRADGLTVAWVPGAMTGAVARPRGRRWAGAIGHRVVIFTVEGSTGDREFLETEAADAQP